LSREGASVRIRKERAKRGLPEAFPSFLRGKASFNHESVADTIGDAESGRTFNLRRSASATGKAS
jgi:hypothetical protein